MKLRDNDTWYRATPLYEDVTQAFDLTAANDTEWFRITVPTGQPESIAAGYHTKRTLVSDSYP